MTKYFCDICPNEIPIQERINVNITTSDGKPVTPACEVCVFCKERLREWLEVNKRLGQSGGGNA